MMRKTLCLLMFFVVSLSAYAADNPYDVYLRAAYCVGFESETANIYENAISRMPQGSDGALTAAQMARQTRDRELRLRGYVMPRMMNSNDVTTIAVSVQRGRTDAGRMSGSDQSLMACSAKCAETIGVPQSERDIDRISQCTLQCNPDLISHARACNDLSWLPF